MLILIKQCKRLAQIFVHVLGKKKWQFLLRTRTFSCPHRVSPIADLVTKASDQLINTTREQSWRLIDQHY